MTDQSKVCVVDNIYKYIRYTVDNIYIHMIIIMNVRAPDMSDKFYTKDHYFFFKTKAVSTR